MAQGFLQTVLDATDTSSDKLREVIEEIESKYAPDTNTEKDQAQGLTEKLQQDDIASSN